MSRTLFPIVDVGKLKERYVGEDVDGALYSMNGMFPHKAVTPIATDSDALELDRDRYRLYILYDPNTMLVEDVFDGETHA